MTALPPGPRIPRLAQAVRYTFDQPGFFAKCRARYGPTWTLSFHGFPPTVVTADREAIQRLFTGDPLRKRHGNDLLRPVLGDRSLLLLEPREHLARRRLELPPFHGEAVRGYGERIRELAHAEVSGWSPGVPVETHSRARALTLEIITELVLGSRASALRSKLSEVLDSFNTPHNNLAQFMPEWLVRRSRWNIASRSVYTRLDSVHALLMEHVVATRADPGLDGRTDVLALLIRAREEDGSALTDEDLRDELMTLVIAGHETTATAIAWGCDLLAHNPAVTERLRETLDTGDRDYLRAAAKEVLRARTVAYVSAGRHLLEPFEIGDWALEPGTVVLVDAQGIHGDPDLHPEPGAFRPERFLGEAPASYSYVPFGGGAHRCLGAALAMLELELVLEAVVTHWTPTPAGPPARQVRRGIIMAPADEGRVTVRARGAQGSSPDSGRVAARLGRPADAVGKVRT